MVNNNQSISIQLSHKNIRQIESLVDTVCDQLFINDTYYGNILVSVTEMFNLLVENNEGNNVSITYFSDYKTMNIRFEPIDLQLISSFESTVDLENTDEQQDSTTIFLIKSLVDKLSLDENMINLEFDISALHNEIYNQRKSMLKEYFIKNTVVDKVKLQDG
jgi:phosphoribosylformylglycinamidine (FGAM) synthase PurS component